MNDVSSANNVELDRLSDDTHALQGELILNSIDSFLGRFVSYPSQDARVAHAVWIVHTHVLRLLESTPRIAFLSPEPGSGKSRALEVTELLVPQAMLVVNVSANYLFRKAADENGAPTVLFDEIDTVFGPKAKEHEEIRGWLNAGHRKGAKAGRCVMRGKEVRTEELSAYCAVAMAGLGDLPDTIMSRSVIIAMRRRHAGEVVEPFRHRIHAPQALPIKTAIEAWTAPWTEFDQWPEMPEQIKDRDADVWEPLIAIGDRAGSKWSTRVRGAAVNLVAAAKNQKPSLGVRLLADLRRVFSDDEQLQTEIVLERLTGLEESPWGDLKGKPLDARTLSRLLERYDISPRQIRFSGKQKRGYEKAAFQEAWLRYLPPSSTPAGHVIAVTSATEMGDDVTNVTRVTCHQGERQSGLTADDPDTGRCAHCGGRGNVVEVFRGAVGTYLHHACVDAWTTANDSAMAPG
jgi:Protein of unknown function (DUF3631)